MDEYADVPVLHVKVTSPRSFDIERVIRVPLAFVTRSRTGEFDPQRLHNYMMDQGFGNNDSTLWLNGENITKDAPFAPAGLTDPRLDLVYCVREPLDLFIKENLSRRTVSIEYVPFMSAEAVYQAFADAFNVNRNEVTILVNMHRLAQDDVPTLLRETPVAIVKRSSGGGGSVAGGGRRRRSKSAGSKSKSAKSRSRSRSRSRPARSKSASTKKNSWMQLVAKIHKQRKAKNPSAKLSDTLKIASKKYHA